MSFQDEKKYILGLETSGKTASVCIYDTEKMRSVGDITIHSIRTQSQIILPMAKELMEKSNVTFEKIGAIAVSEGPGSYTGIRIGIAAAKAMAFAENIGVFGVSSLEALAYMPRKLFCGDSGDNRNYGNYKYVASIIPARTDLYYTAIYSETECVKEPCLMQIDDICETVEKLGNVIFCGEYIEDFYKYYTEKYNAENISRFTADVTAVDLCRTAYETMYLKHGEEPQDPELVNAAYTQKTEAERNLEEKEKARVKEG